MRSSYDVIIIGAGAAGLFCAATAGMRGRSVLVLDHAKKIGEKIRISGGGRCNFTNLNTAPDRFISQNPHFCKSALSQYTQHDFIDLVNRYRIGWHEKKLGQLFCNESAGQIIDMLLTEAQNAGADIAKDTAVSDIQQTAGGFSLLAGTKDTITAQSLVIATGGLSIPKIGASKFGYDIARQFDLPVVQTRAGLVPLTFQSSMLEACKSLSGLSVDARVMAGNTGFSEGLLFTHRGLSGPSILQISSYWREGDDIAINLYPASDILQILKDQRKSAPKRSLSKTLSALLPARLGDTICQDLGIQGNMADLSDAALKTLAARIEDWHVRPGGTEGYRTAEVTLGGVDTNALSSKTMECKTVPGLYFIGEVMDVTGHLGGYNFQWAWSSGYVAGMNT